MSEVLTKLTPEQEAAMSLWQDKWLEIGLSTTTEPLSEVILRPMVDRVYESLQMPSPTQIILTQSPAAGAREAHRLSGGKGTVADQLSQCFYGTMDASWIAFYQFFRHECGVKTELNLDPIATLSMHVGWWWPFTEAVVISPRPAEIHMRHGRLHRDLGQAVRYLDGFGVYALNGIRFIGDDTRWITTPAADLDPTAILGIKNVEQRAEVIKKYGVPKLLSSLSVKQLDKNDMYELLLVDLQAYRPRIYLKMNNPSVAGEIHIEAVHPDCNTIAKALSWRNFGTVAEIFQAPTVLT